MIQWLMRVRLRAWLGCCAPLLIDNSDIHINQFFGQGKLPFSASAERATNAHARVVRDARGDGASWL